MSINLYEARPIQMSNYHELYSLQGPIFENADDKLFTEAVFTGGKERLKPVEKAIQAIKDELDSEIDKHGSAFDPVAFWRDPLWKDLMDALQEAFGFRYANINPFVEKYYKSQDVFASCMLNAMVNSNTRFPIDGLITDKGFYDKTKSVQFDMYITLGLIRKLDADEIVGCILHEIGHGVDPALVDIKYQGTGVLVDYITDRKKKRDPEFKKPKSHPFRDALWMLLNAFTLGIPTIISDIYKGTKGAIEKRFQKLQKQINSTSAMKRQDYSETFADNFARMYGYGGALGRGLEKMEKDYADSINKRFSRESDRQRYIITMTENALRDIHQTDVQRVRALIAEYKKDLDDPNISAVAKKNIKEDMEDLQKVLDMYLNDFSEMQNRINRAINAEIDEEEKKEIEEAKKKEAEKKDDKKPVKESVDYYDEAARNKARSASEMAKIRKEHVQQMAKKSDFLAVRTGAAKSSPQGSISSDEKRKVREAIDSCRKDNERRTIILGGAGLHNADTQDRGRTESKFGGIPYWPAGKPYPTPPDKYHFMYMLAQINFAQMPKLEGYPDHGIVQLFVTPDEMYGRDGKDMHQVVYHERVSENPKDWATIPMEHTTLGMTKNWYDNGDYYVSIPVRKLGVYGSVNGKLSITHPHPMHKEYYKLLTPYLDKALGAGWKNTASSALKSYIHDYAWQWSCDELYGSRIGGWHGFTQNDPIKSGNVLLFQLDSDWFFDWGDCGMGAIYINENSLKSKTITNTTTNYEWDCY